MQTLGQRGQKALIRRVKPADAGDADHPAVGVAAERQIDRHVREEAVLQKIFRVVDQQQLEGIQLLKTLEICTGVPLVGSGCFGHAADGNGVAVDLQRLSLVCQEVDADGLQICPDGGVVKHDLGPFVVAGHVVHRCDLDKFSAQVGDDGIVVHQFVVHVAGDGDDVRLERGDPLDQLRIVVAELMQMQIGQLNDPDVRGQLVGLDLIVALDKALMLCNEGEDAPQGRQQHRQPQHELKDAQDDLFQRAETGLAGRVMRSQNVSLLSGS